MKNSLAILTAALTLCGTATAQNKLERTFEGIETIDISVSSGDAYFTKGSGETVSLEMTHDIDDYDPTIEKRGNRLVIKEENRRGNWGNRGSSTWKFQIPDNIEIEFNTGSGDGEVSDLTTQVSMNSGSGSFRLDNVDGDSRMNTGSGDFEIRDCKGEYRVNTGSGDIKIKNSAIEVDANTGSGDLDITGLTLAGHSNFNSGSGDVEVTLAKALDYDISVNSGSGNAVLDFDSNKIEGQIVMKVNKKRGRIKAPFEFDTVEEVDNGGRDNVTVIKTKEMGDKDIRIRISSGSGTAELID